MAMGATRPRTRPKHRVAFKPKLHRKQKIVQQSRARFKVLAAGRRFGKTFLCMVIALAVAMRGGAVWWVAPTVDLTKRGWRPTERLCRTIPGAVIRVAEKRIEFPGGGFLEFKTAGTEVSLRGEGLDLVIVEEAAFMEEERWTQELRPSLADRAGSAIFISTPYGFNWFFDLFERGQSEEHPDWESWQFTSYDNPFIDDAEIDAAAEDMSEEEFAQEHLAKFLEAGGTPAFRREWFDHPLARYAFGDPRVDRQAVGRFAALDTANTAKEHSAFNALTVANLRPDYSLALRDVKRERLEFPYLRDWLVEMLTPWMTRDRVPMLELYIENRASGVQLIQDIDYAGPHWLRAITVPVDVSPLKGGQENDWRDAAPWCRRGMVALPGPGEGAEWLPEFERELFNVPNHDYWDQATSFSHLINNVQRREEAPLSTGWHWRKIREMEESGMGPDELTYGMAGQ